MPEIPRLGLPPPSSNDQPDGPGIFGRQLQTARCDHGQSHHLCDDRRQSAKPQCFLEGFKNIFLPDCFDVDNAVRVEPDLGQPRREEIGPRQTPDDLACGSSRYTCNKNRGRGSIDRPYSPAGEFVDGPISQSTSRQVRVNLSHSKWKDRFSSCRSPFEMLDAVSKIGNNGIRAGPRHSKPSSKQVFILFESEYVSYLFRILESMCIYRRVTVGLQPDHLLRHRKNREFNRLLMNGRQALKCHR